MCVVFLVEAARVAKQPAQSQKQKTAAPGRGPEISMESLPQTYFFALAAGFFAAGFFAAAFLTGFLAMMF